MGVFASMYYHSFIATDSASVGTVLEYALQNLDLEGLVKLHFRLGQYLEGQGLEI